MTNTLVLIFEYTNKDNFIQETKSKLENKEFKTLPVDLKVNYRKTEWTHRDNYEEIYATNETEGFWMYVEFYKNLVVVQLPYRFIYFLSCKEVHVNCIGIAHEFARYFGSKYIIYQQESDNETEMFSSKSIKQVIESQLKDNKIIPKTKIPQLAWETAWKKYEESDEVAQKTTWITKIPFYEIIEN